MRILILGAGGAHRTEGALARAARALGHEALVLDALGWRRRLRALAGPVLRWKADAFAADLVLCTRHAVSSGERSLRHILRGRTSAFWYFDAIAPLPPRVVALARLVTRTFATYGYQTDAFVAAGCEAHFLPQGVDPDLDHPAADAPAEFRCEVSFIGSGQFGRRHALLERIAAHHQLQVRGSQWGSAPSSLPVVGGKVEGAAFAQAVRGATISLGIDALDLQRTEQRGGTSNRLWKVLGAEGLYLGEHVPGIEQFAKDGVHAAWYRSPDEALTRIAGLLGDPAECQRIRAAGRAHVLAHHTYRHRLERLLAGQGYTST